MGEELYCSDSIFIFFFPPTLFLPVCLLTPLFGFHCLICPHLYSSIPILIIHQPFFLAPLLTHSLCFCLFLLYMQLSSPTANLPHPTLTSAEAQPILWRLEWQSPSTPILTSPTPRTIPTLGPIVCRKEHTPLLFLLCTTARCHGCTHSHSSSSPPFPHLGTHTSIGFMCTNICINTH